MANLVPKPKMQFFDANGNPLAGGKVYTYAAGTNTPLATYTDASGGTPNTNPVILDSRGQASIWVGAGQYKFVVYDANDVLQPDGGDNINDANWATLSALSAANGASLIGGGAQVVGSISALRALLKTSASNKAIVAGYCAAGDGGGGIYYYDSTDTTSADNGGTIIVASDGGRWKLVHFDEVAIDQFGGDFNAAFAAVTTVVVPSGKTYTASFAVPSGKRLINRGTINGTVSVSGSALNATNTVNVAGVNGTWTNYPAGTTTFPGNFAAYNVGDMVAVELTTVGSASQNQAGKDFAFVSSANGSQIVLDTPTRFPYDIPSISKVIGTKVTGALARGAMTISGDYTGKFAAGDLIRIENINGTDTIDGSTSYFEMVKVRSISAAAITLEVPIAYSYTDYYLVKTGHISDIKISGGGYIDTVSLNYAEKIDFEDMTTRVFGAGGLYNFSVSDVRTLTDQPRGHGYTWCRNGTVSDIKTSGATGSTDNAAFKMMSCIGVTMSNVNAFNTSASAQGVYPVFIDYYFHPYKSYTQDCALSNIACGTPSAGQLRSAWFVGMRAGFVNGVSVIGIGSIDIERCTETAFGKLVNPSGNLNITNSPSVTVDGFSCKALNPAGAPNCVIGPGVVSGAAGSNSGRCVWVRGSTLYSTSDNIKLRGICNNSQTAGDTSFYIQGAANVYMSDCVDNAGLASSVTIGSGTVTINYGANSLNNPIANSSASNGSAQIPGDVVLSDSAYDRRRLRLGGYYMWVDGTGRLRIKSGAPTSSTDGTVVGTQT